MHAMPVYVPAADDAVLAPANTAYGRGTQL